MKRGFGFWAFVGIALVALAATASATIIGTSGQMTKIAPPPSVLFDALESDTTMFAFDEQQNVTLAQPLSVDITTPGTYDDSADLTPGTIPAGTAVSSHFVNADHVGTGVPRVTLDGTVTTDKDILGIAILAKALNDSDYLGAPGTLYPTGEFGRGFNLDNQDDFVIEQIDKRTVQIHSDVRIHSDQVRIITEADGPPPPPVQHGKTQGFWGNKNGQALLVANDAFSPAKAVELGIPGLCYVKVDSQAKSTADPPEHEERNRAHGLQRPSRQRHQRELVQQSALADPRVELQHPLPGRLCGSDARRLGLRGGRTADLQQHRRAGSRLRELPDRQRQAERR